MRTPRPWKCHSFQDRACLRSVYSCTTLCTASQTPCIRGGQSRSIEATSQGNSPQQGTKPRTHWQLQQCWEDVALDGLSGQSMLPLFTVGFTYRSDMNESGVRFHFRPEETRFSGRVFKGSRGFHTRKSSTNALWNEARTSSTSCRPVFASCASKAFMPFKLQNVYIQLGSRC